MKKIIYQILLIMSILAIWQVVEDTTNYKRINNNETSLELFVPTPKKIAKTFIENKKIIINEVLYTIFRASAGFIIGNCFAFIMIIVFVQSPILRELLIPIMTAFNSFPVNAFSPLIILAFGQGSNIGIIFVSTLISYFPTLVILDKSVFSTKREFIEMMQLLGANNWDIFKKIRIPMSIPSLLSAAKLSIPASIIGTTTGEWLGTKHGVGHLVAVSFYQLKPEIAYASLFALTSITLLAIFIIKKLENSLFPWNKKEFY